METNSPKCYLCKNDLKLELNYSSINLIKTSCSKTVLRVVIEKIIKRKINTNQNNYVCDGCVRTLNDFDYVSKRFEAIRQKILDYFESGFSTVSVDCQTDISLINAENSIVSCPKIISKHREDDSYAVNVHNFNINVLKNDLNVKNENDIDKGDVEDLPVLENTSQYSEQVCDSNTADEIQSKPDNKKLRKCSKGSKTLSKPFICEICGQSYRLGRALKIHVDMHKGISPFTCLHCNKSFTQKAALKRHFPVHTGETPYICDTCGKRFKHHTSFHIHKLSHTGEKKYKCSYCESCFFSTSHLRRHLKIHTNEKNHVCSICGRGFAEKYNLLVHQKLHYSQLNNCKSDTSHNLRCQVCQQVFKLKNKFLRHLSQKHQIITDIDINSLENVFGSVTETHVE